jgi:hypothetical protein
VGIPYIVRNKCLLDKFIFSIHQVHYSEYPAGKVFRVHDFGKNIFSMNLAAKNI